MQQTLSEESPLLNPLESEDVTVESKPGSQALACDQAAERVGEIRTKLTRRISFKYGVHFFLFYIEH